MSNTEKIEKALRALESLNEAKREKAVNFLAGTRDPRVLPALEKTARTDQSLKLRFLAKEGLQQLRLNLTQETNLDGDSASDGKTGPSPINLERLQTHLNDPDPAKRGKAVKSAMAYMNPTALKVLVPHVRKERNLKVKGSCVLSLGILGNQEQIPLLLHYLEHKEAHLRARAAMALTNINDVSIFPRLVHSMADRDQSVRNISFKALLRLGKPKLLKLLNKMALSQQMWMRFAAAKACGKFKSLRILNILAISLRDQETKVRKVARASLRRLNKKGMAEAGKLLEEYRRAGGEMTETEITLPDLAALQSPVNSDNADERLAEIQRIITEKDTSLLEMVKTRLDVEENEHVIASLLMALGKLGGKEMVATLSHFLASEKRRVKASAVEALSFINDPSVVPLLLPLLQDTDNRVKGNTIVALKDAPNVDVLPSLKELLLSDERNSKLSAVYAILELQRLDATKMLSLLDDDPDDLIQKRLKRARQILADTSLMGGQKTSSSVSSRMEIPQELKTQAPSADDIQPSTATGSPLTDLVSEVSGKTVNPEAEGNNKKQLPGFRTQIDNMFAQAAKEPKLKKSRSTKAQKAPGKPSEDLTRENFLDRIKGFFSGDSEEKEKSDGTPDASNIVIICAGAVLIFLVGYYLFGIEDESANDDYYEDDDF